MGFVKRIEPEIKKQILKRIKEEGVTANQAANDAGISPKTVYNWLSKKGNTDVVSWHEHNHLKRENNQLKQIIGNLTLDISRTKKNKGTFKKNDKEKRSSSGK